MKRNLKPIVLGLAVLGALSLNLARTSHDGPGALELMSSSGAAKRGGRGSAASLRIFERVLLRITDNYVDPQRIKPQAMLLAGLHAVERSVAEVLVKESPDKRLVTVRVSEAERSFDISGVDSPWNLSATMREIFGFIQPQLQPGSELDEVEYAAINGALSTLDPHSVLLQPDIYNEMKLSTRGEFGGLGIVISMIEGVLTVIKPMKGTPAEAAQIKACDQILKIGEESTVNMTLTQAVQRLRGAPGSTVSITMARKGQAQPVRKVLRRSVIKVESVTARLLDGKVGYIQLSSFQGNSLDDLRAQLVQLQRQGMKALVLDLRNNPGGLLDQAIKISDVFIDSGTLVTTVSGAGRRREEKRAHRDQTEGRYPIAVLVNSGSASASEIVAGALKNLDRAVVIGRGPTFGKGSVQVLYDNDDGSALKLTIAQYLTPGDISIQSVGIMPDVLTVPVVVRKDFLRLRRTDSEMREDDLKEHLANGGPKQREPDVTLRYLHDLPEPAHAEDFAGESEEGEASSVCLFPDRKCKPDEEDRFVEDFQIRLAKELLRQGTGWRRSQLLAGAAAFFAKAEAQEQQRIAGALKGLGVDWSPGRTSASAKPRPAAAAMGADAVSKPRVAVTAEVLASNQVVSACSTAELEVTVRNQGSVPTYQLAAITESSNPTFAHRELVFGAIKPGEARTWSVPVKVRDLPTRVDEVRIKLSDAQGTEYPVHSVPVSIRGAERPVFSYGYQLIDDLRGNRDGRAQRGEQVRLLVQVKNTGSGAAYRAVTTLQNLAGVGIFIGKGRFVLGRMEPGETKSASFTFDVEPQFKEQRFKMELAVFDEGLQESISEKLDFRVAAPDEGPKAADGVVELSSQSAPMRAWAAADAPVVGYAAGAARFKVLGVTEGREWYRLQVGPDRVAFGSAKDLRPAGKGQAPAPRFTALWQVTPPRIALKVPSYSTDKATMRIEGEATDETRVSDLYIFVRNPEAKIELEKVYYKSNRRSDTPKSLRFGANIPLWAGANYVTVFARENNNVQAHRLAVIYRQDGRRGQVAKSDKPSGS